MEDATQLIVGTWRLVHAIISEADGKKRYPFGEEPLGDIDHSDTGIMAVQISRKSRTEAKELSRLKHDYLAYFGRYEIDRPAGGPPSLGGAAFCRRSSRDSREKVPVGDLLSLRPVDMSNYEILWQRVRG